VQGLPYHIISTQLAYAHNFILNWSLALLSLDSFLPSHPQCKLGKGSAAPDYG